MLLVRDLTVEVNIGDRATVAHIINPETGNPMAHGEAIRRVTDEPHDCVGDALATGRALVQLGEELIRQGLAMSDHNDNF